MISVAHVLLGPLVLVLFVQLRRKLDAIGKKYPPGPTGYPIFGNIFDVPVVGPWNYFIELGKQYGPLTRLTLAGDEMLVLNDPKDAEELLAKRSSNYSSRKPLIYAGKYQSQNKRLLLLEYGDELKRQRTAFADMLNPRVVGSYEALHEHESVRLMHDMLSRPDEYKLNMKRFTASLVFTLTYGRRLNDDQNLRDVLQILLDFLPDCAPGAHLVDSFPILDRLPNFLAPWRKVAQAKHEFEKKLYIRLVEDVRAEMEAGVADECFTVKLWAQHAQGKIDLLTMAYVAGSAFEASIGTTSGTLLWFLVAMILHPEAQRTAQTEINDYLASTNSPDMPKLADMKHLPYCVALTKEVLRWMPVAPGAFPHYSVKEDTYKGYTIPAKTLVMPNVWGMHRDERNFEDPLEFKPERYLGKGDLDSAEVLTEGHWGFGFGRRICPARYLASKSIFIVIIRMLWGFNVEHALDKNGRPIPVNPYSSTFNIIFEPHDFPLRMTPRNSKRAQAIEEEFANLEFQ